MKNDAIPENAKLVQGKNCYVCGRDNRDGLQIPFYFDGNCVTAKFAPGDKYCGFEQVVHGGIIFAIADEAMMHLIWAKGLRAMTAEVTIRFQNYAKTNEELNVTAEIISLTPHLIEAKATVKSCSGRKLARATGKFLPFSIEQNESFRKIF